MSGEIKFYCCKYCKVLIDSQYKENYKHLKKDKTDFIVICKKCVRKHKNNDDIHLDFFTKDGHMYINDKLIEKYNHLDILKNTDPKARVYIKCLICDKKLKSCRNQLYTHLLSHAKRKHNVNNS